MTEQANVVPFGKYKGRGIEELLIDDPAYLQWLASQDWFRTKFVALHQIIINRGAEPDETPEHNALQVLFLDDAFCLQFARRIEPNFEENLHKRLERERQGGIATVKTTLTRGYWPSGRSFNREQAEQELLALSDPTTKLQVHRQFEVRGIDVILSISLAMTRPDTPVEQGPKLHIELKPTVGDDYPAVLRQMRASYPAVRPHTVPDGANVLLLEQYTGKGATQEQFVQTFKTANITVVFRDELPA
jgi:uncharacterized protein (DUF3820 family)